MKGVFDAKSAIEAMMGGEAHGTSRAPHFVLVRSCSSLPAMLLFLDLVRSGPLVPFLAGIG